MKYRLKLKDGIKIFHLKGWKKVVKREKSFATITGTRYEKSLMRL